MHQSNTAQSGSQQIKNKILKIRVEFDFRRKSLKSLKLVYEQSVLVLASIPQTDNTEGIFF